MRPSTSRRNATPSARCGPFVQHHAFRALRRRRVGHFGAAGHAVAHELVQHLGRPDDRRARRLAQPEDLLLHFGQPGEADLDREVAARDHHRGRMVRQRLAGSAWGRLRTASGVSIFSTIGCGGSAAPARRQMVLQQLDVLDPLHERKADEVGIGGDEIEVAEILGVSGGRSSSVVGKLSPLSGLAAPLFRERRKSRFRASSSSIGVTRADALPSSTNTSAPTSS